MARVWKFGSDVDTDQIVPGRYAPYMLKSGQDVKDFAFIEARPEFAREAEPGDILIAGENFGCGSSREYAPEALRRRQIGAIVAAGFARIFFRNAINLGIPVYESADISEQLTDGEIVDLDVAAGTIGRAAGELLRLPELPPFAAEIIRAGGLTTFVRDHGRFPGENPESG